MNISWEERMTEVIVEKIMWVVSLLPGNVSLTDSPAEISDRIIWVPEEDSEDNVTEAKIYVVVPNHTKEHALAISFYFESDSMKNSVIEPVKIQASLENYPEEGQKAVLVISSRIEKMALPPIEV